MSLVVDNAQPVRIAVGGDADVGVILQNCRLQCAQRIHIRRGQPSAEQGVVPLMDDAHVAPGRQQNGLQRGAAHAVHGIQHDLQVPATDGVHVHPADDGIQILVLRVDLLHHACGNGALVFNRVNLVGVYLVGRSAQLVGHAFHCVPTAPGKELDAIIQRGIVAGRHGNAVIQPVILHGEHNQRRRRFPVDHQHMNALARHDLRSPFRSFPAQKAPVVADAEALVRHFLPLHPLGKGEHQLAHVFLGEVIADNGAPAACTKRNHSISPLSW